MNPKIYLIIEDDADQYCGYYVISVWSTRELAEQNIDRGKGFVPKQEIIERTLDGGKE